MDRPPYEIRYLPIFNADLTQIMFYISQVLHSPKAAEKLLADLETAIQKRLYCPLAFEPYPTKIKRPYPYYRIYVGNYTLYYVVIGHTVEMRRMVYSRRNQETLLP